MRGGVPSSPSSRTRQHGPVAGSLASIPPTPHKGVAGVAWWSIKGCPSGGTHARTVEQACIETTTPPETSNGLGRPFGEAWRWLRRRTENPLLGSVEIALPEVHSDALRTTRRHADQRRRRMRHESYASVADMLACDALSALLGQMVVSVQMSPIVSHDGVSGSQLSRIVWNGAL